MTYQFSRVTQKGIRKILTSIRDLSCVAVIWSIGSDVRAQVSSTPTVEGTPDAVSQPFGGINLDRLRRADFLSRVGFRDAETARSSGVPSSDIQSGSNQLGPGGGKGKASAQSACPHGCKSSFCPHRSGRFFLPTDGPDSAVAKDGLDGKEANLSFPHRLINAYVSPGDEAEESSTDRPSGVSRSSYNPDDKSQGLSSGGATGGASGGGESRGVIPFVSSPPFPFADHLGPVIGTRDTSVHPLMEALYNGPRGNWYKDSRIKIYGWLDPSVNFGTSRKSNIPESYAIYPDKLQLSQAIVIFERQVDSVQTDYYDWGFKFTNLYGIDYRYTTGKGYFSDQLLKHNHLYGYDPLQMYADFYVPQVLDGMIIRAGRYISPIDIEAQLSPENYLYSHSVMYTYDPYTFTGIQAITKVNKNWSFILGVHGGNDMALWTTSTQVNGEVLLKYITDSGNDSFWGGIDSVGKGYFKNGHDDLQIAALTWSHKFNENLHTITEMYYLWQRNALSGGTVTNGPSKPYFEGVGPGAKIPGLSDSFGIVNYTPYKLSDKSYVVLRNDSLADFEGQRTGFATTYFEHTLGYIHHVTPWLTLRPEIRFEYTTGAKAYDNGTRRDQFTVSADAIIRF